MEPLLEPLSKISLESPSKLIEFIINYCKKTFLLSLDDIIELNKETGIQLKAIIKAKCATAYDIIIYEGNIKMYDYENNVFITKINDLIQYKTKKCSIIIVPMICHSHM